MEVYRKYYALERFVTLWLAKISLTPAMQKKNPEAVQKLLKYQLEAADVLHKAFYETEEQKSAFYNRMGLEGEIAELKEQLKMTTIQLNNVEETLDVQNEKLDAVMDNITLTTVQQGRLQRAVKDRVNHLLIVQITKRGHVHILSIFGMRLKNDSSADHVGKT